MFGLDGGRLRRGGARPRASAPETFGSPAFKAEHCATTTDSGPADWKPANHAFWCAYAKDYTHIKSVWKLTTTADEKSALSSMFR
ncbi:hypothetical protein ACIPSA_42815 [Streptomyces sp. NPDC086549]|uniref:hypothetical protein n=1 Tax=Streptomyces sp. NPDC086549 TaxID=3365752 RepID=UPI00381845AF